MNKELLRQLNGQRVALEATVSDFRTVEGYTGPMRVVLLTKITTADGTPLLDEHWCALTKGHRALRLQLRDRIAFCARVKLVRPRISRYSRAPSVLEGRPVLLSHPTHLRLVLPCARETTH